MKSELRGKERQTKKEIKNDDQYTGLAPLAQTHTQLLKLNFDSICLIQRNRIEFQIIFITIHGNIAYVHVHHPFDALLYLSSFFLYYSRELSCQPVVFKRNKLYCIYLSAQIRWMGVNATLL